jgi:hypothetical protein
MHPRNLTGSFNGSETKIQQSMPMWRSAVLSRNDAVARHEFGIEHTRIAFKVKNPKFESRAARRALGCWRVDGNGPSLTLLPGSYCFGTQMLPGLAGNAMVFGRQRTAMLSWRFPNQPFLANLNRFIFTIVVFAFSNAIRVKYFQDFSSGAEGATNLADK